MKVALGLDIGTTAVKAIALDEEGRVVARAGAAHDLMTPHPGWAEGDPDAWWTNAVACIRRVGQDVPLAEVASVGVSGMVPALVLLGAGNRPLRPSIQQNDGRTGEEIAALRERLDDEAFFAATGQPFSQQLIGPKLLWLARHESAVAGAIRRVLGSYDYVTWRLAGEWSLEQNWALESGLWDVRRRDWYRPALHAAGIDEDWLAPVRAPHEVVGGVTRGAARETGLSAGTPVVAGSADHVAAALAAQAAPGEVVLKIGGAGDVLFAVDRFAPDPRLYIDYHDVPGLFLLNGCMATSGSLVKWLAAECARELGAGEDAYARLDAEAAATPAGSDGLVALPYFLGEKTPLFDPAARGVFFGLTLSHRRGHLHRALLEGWPTDFATTSRCWRRAGTGSRACASWTGARGAPSGARSSPTCSAARWRMRPAPTSAARTAWRGWPASRPASGAGRAGAARRPAPYCTSPRPRRPPGIASATASTGISTRVWRRPSPPRRGAEPVMNGRVERVLCWALIGLVALVAVVALRDSWLRVGRVAPGFALMENGQAGAGGAPRRGLAPLDVITAVNGRPVSGATEILAEVERHPSGTSLTYALRRGSQRLVASLPTRTITLGDFGWSLVDGTLPGLLVLALGALVFVLRPGTPESRLFLAFCLVSATINLTYNDLVTTHRFTRLLLALWAFTPALLLHLALTFPERRSLVDRWPWVIPLPYAASAGLAAWLLVNFMRFTAPVGEIVAGYAGLAALALIASLGWTVLASPTLAARRRARVLLWGVGIGYVLPLLGTSAEIVTGATVPHLHLVWQLNFVFPAAVAYAIVRYQLFDVRAVVRMGAVYSVVTGLVALVYVGLLTGLDLFLARMHLDVAPVVSSAGVALAVVLLMNPVYGRVRMFVDRLFFRDRYDAQRALESLAHQMTTVLELDRLEALVTRTADEIFRPEDVVLLLPADGARGLRGLSRAGRAAHLADDGPLMHVLTRLRSPVTRARLREDPDLAAMRETALGELEAAGAEAAAPIFFRDRVTAVLALGRRRGDAEYLGRICACSARSPIRARWRSKMPAPTTRLEAALRRVQILESIRANLSKFVPRVVQDLIERAPEAPALAKRDVDVSVLFVDIVGYSRLSDRLDAARLNHLVERYFGAFLDEILGQGGDVNETAGDGLMVIFQDPDPRRHAVAAALAGLGVLRRTAEINAAMDVEPGPPAEPIGVHVGVNSGVAAVGATRIEGLAGTRWTYTASGPVTNVAARLAALGEGDAVMLGGQTRRRLGPEFAPEDLGETELRNIDEPVRVFRLRPPPEEASARAVPAAGRRD